MATSPLHSAYEYWQCNQIDMPDFEPDIDEGLLTQEHQEVQGLLVLHNSLSKNLMNVKPCFIAMRCRRSGLAGCNTYQNPTTTGPRHRTKYTSITNKMQDKPH